MVQAPLNIGLTVYQLPEMPHRITLANRTRSIGDLRLFSGGYRTSFRTHDSLLPPSPPPNLHGRSTSLHCQHRRDAGAIYARPLLWSHICSYYGTCSQTFGSATSMQHFQAVDDTYGNGKLPWRSASCCCTVGLFLAPTIEH